MLAVQPLFVFILRFEHRGALERAFRLVADQLRVADCIVEVKELRIRFHATADVGVQLLERIDERGGLTWCERYPLKRPCLDAPDPPTHPYRSSAPVVPVLHAW